MTSIYGVTRLINVLDVKCLFHHVTQSKYECGKKGRPVRKESQKKRVGFDANSLIENGSFCQIMMKIKKTSKTKFGKFG